VWDFVLKELMEWLFGVVEHLFGVFWKGTVVFGGWIRGCKEIGG
jgi:hypothetical protein